MIHFDPKIWRQRFISNESNTAWKCGYCGIGAIQLKAKVPKLKEIAIQAVCTDDNCKRTFSLVGRVVPVSNGREVYNEYFLIDDLRLYPSHFYPELVLFEFPVALSDRVKVRLLQSFNHFWYDLDACANKIRQAIEIIVESKGGTGNNLDQKIESLRQDLGGDLADAMLALKWIGNDGSHPGRSFSHDQILGTYEVLVDVLNHLYPDDSEKERRRELVKFAIENRGIKEQ